MKLHPLILAFATTMIITPAFATSAGTWSLGVGAGYVVPASDNGKLANNTLSVDVEEDIQPTITGEYFVANNIGIELLAATPFRHDINLDAGGGNVIEAKTKHLPPTLSVQYYFENNSKITPFVGIGANYTLFFDEKIYLPSGDAKLEIEDSAGVAGHVGVDFTINDDDAIRVDARYINIEPDVKLDGNKIGTADINPWVFGVSYVQKF